MPEENLSSSLKKRKGEKSRTLAISTPVNFQVTLDLITRLILGLGLFVLVAVLAIQAANQDGAMPVLDKLLSLLGIAVAFFFGQKSTSSDKKDDL